MSKIKKDYYSIENPEIMRLLDLDSISLSKSSEMLSEESIGQ
jgi:hypothetical protein